MMKHRLEYGALRGLEFFFSLLPLRAAVAVGQALAVGVSKFLPKRRRLILDNLRHAFPHKSAAEIEAIAKKVWLNLGRVAAEFICLPAFFEKTKSHLTWEGAEAVDKALKEGRGVIFTAAHFTNWEVLGAFLAARFGHFTAIARPMHNPYVEKLVQDKRTRAGVSTIYHREAVKASLRWLKKSNIIGILVDQNLYTGGEFVSFFGRPAATTTLPALLHSRTNAPVFVTYCVREGKGFHIVIEPPVLAPTTANENVILAHTQALSDRFENIIRRHPESWFWIHNRWKRKQ